MARQNAAAFSVFVILAIVMTWPLTANLTRAVAWPGDPYINSWILDWDWYATFHQPLHLFDANVFYPARYSLAYSENLFGIALLLFPFRALGIAPIAAHNLAILAGFALSGFVAYLLGRYISGGALAGFVSGIFYAFLPFRFTHLAHVQHVWGWTLPLLLLALSRYKDKPSWKRASIFAGIFLFNGLCNIHWLLFGAIAIAITVALIRPRLLPLLTCTAIAALVLLAFLWPYVEVTKLYGMQRSWEETMQFSALPSDWLMSNQYSKIYSALSDPIRDPERFLFPGALALLLGAVGLLSSDRKAVRIASAWILTGFAGSLGLHTIFHRFLFSHVIGFRAIRVPARWAAIAYVGLAILVAIGAAMIARRRKWAYALLAMAFLVELRAAPIRWYMSVPDPRLVDRWISQNRPRALLELPMGRADYDVMLRSTTHHRPMVNGVSGFSPPEYQRIAGLANMGSDALVPELKRIGVTHIIVHADLILPPVRAWLERSVQRGELGLIRRFDGGLGGEWLFAVGVKSPPSPELDAMLRGEVTRSDGIAAALFSPAPWEPVSARTVMQGIASSPHGIREVNLLMNNGAIRLKTTLRGERFVAHFTRRPEGVWRHTDIQPEIIDGKGNRLLLEDRFIEWP